MYSVLTRNGCIFRGTNDYASKVWRDWVLVDWGEDEGHLPNRIWGFVDLRHLPDDFDAHYGSISVTPGIYAVVENSRFAVERRLTFPSKLFCAIEKQVVRIVNNQVEKLLFLLADIEAFVEPLAVIPDIGGRPNRYLLLRNRHLWAEDFAKWLETPHDLRSVADERAEVQRRRQQQENAANGNVTGAN